MSGFAAMIAPATSPSSRNLMREPRVAYSAHEVGLVPRPVQDAQTTTSAGRALDAGYDVKAVLTLNDMVRSDNVFVAATGVTDGEMLRGVYYSPDRATTHSISMLSLSGAVRLIETRHRISTSNLIRRG